MAIPTFGPQEPRDQMVAKVFGCDEQDYTTGFDCPTCGQRVQLYRRSLYGTIVAALMKMHAAGGAKEYVHVPTVTKMGGDTAKLRWWGLIEPKAGDRVDGSPRNGQWKVTQAGVDFIRGRTRLPSHALTLLGTVLRLDDDKSVSVHDALGKKFDYQELIGAGTDG